MRRLSCLWPEGTCLAGYLGNSANVIIGLCVQAARQPEGEPHLAGLKGPLSLGLLLPPLLVDRHEHVAGGPPAGENTAGG